MGLPSSGAVTTMCVVPCWDMASDVSQVEVRSDRDGRLARRVSGGEPIEVPPCVTEDDVAIGHHRAGSRFVRARDDDGVDVIRGENAGYRPQGGIGRAGDDT
jgi:hypothetical protein